MIIQINSHPSHIFTPWIIYFNGIYLCWRAIIDSNVQVVRKLVCLFALSIFARVAIIEVKILIFKVNWKKIKFII